MNIDLLSRIVRSNPITDQLVTRLRLLGEYLYHYCHFVRHFGRLGLYKSECKFSSDLRIRVHAIEKGLSLPNPRVGFGEAKVKIILEMVDYYINHFKYQQSFLIEINSILSAYFDYQKANGYINKELTDSFNRLFSGIERSNYLGGIKTIHKTDIIQSCTIQFKNFCDSRFAIRDFSNIPVDISEIYKAIEMSQKTPSACNRQPWHVYIYKGEKKKQILEWQHGSMGFGDEIDTALLVCCNTESYFMGESTLPYVDGGLYAMTLIYALHSLGLGTIPLTMGLMPSKLKEIYKIGNIHENEVPVLLIGVGNLKDSFNVALSHRYDYKSYTTLIE